MQDFLNNEIKPYDTVVFLSGGHYHGFRTGTVIAWDEARVTIKNEDGIWRVKPDTNIIVINRHSHD